MKFRGESGDPQKDGTDEVMVAHAIVMGQDKEDFVLNSLTLPQLRLLCKTVGISYVNSKNKFQCRKALDMQWKETLRRAADGSCDLEERKAGNIIRLTNILFSHDFLDDFLKLNDIKGRNDFELGTMPKDFWQDVSDAYNSTEDNEAAILIVLNSEDIHFGEVDECDLEEFEQMEKDHLKKKVQKMFQVRSKVISMRSVSGTHESDPYCFMENAMMKVGRSGLATVGCYYFFKRCDENPDVDKAFQSTMDSNLLGSTAGALGKVGGSASDKKDLAKTKKEAFAAICEMGEMAKTISAQMAATNDIAKNSQLISLATTLGRTELLGSLLEGMMPPASASNAPAASGPEEN